MNTMNLLYKDSYLGPFSMDIDEVTKSIIKIYKLAGLHSPKVVFFKSVLAAEFAISLKYKLYPYSYLNEQFDPFMSGQCVAHHTDSFWEELDKSISDLNSWFKADEEEQITEFCKYVLAEGNDNGRERTKWLNRSFLPLFYSSHGDFCPPKPLTLDLLFKPTKFLEQLELINQNSFCWYPFSKVALVVEFPTSIKLNHRQSLHCDDGPATIWPDGTSTWHLNGTLVPGWAITITATDIDAYDIYFAPSQRVRREIINKIGIDKLIEIFRGFPIDRQGNYELIAVDMGNGFLQEDEERFPSRIQHYLKMRNPSTGGLHFEGVPPDCTTVGEAIAWRNGTREEPVILT